MGRTFLLLTTKKLRCQYYNIFICHYAKTAQCRARISNFMAHCKAHSPNSRKEWQNIKFLT